MRPIKFYRGRLVSFCLRRSWVSTSKSLVFEFSHLSCKSILHWGFSGSVKHQVALRNRRLPFTRQKDILKQCIALHIGELTAIHIRMLIQPAIQPVTGLVQSKRDIGWFEMERIGRESARSSGRTPSPPNNDHGKNDQRPQCCADESDAAHLYSQCVPVPWPELSVADTHAVWC